MSARGDWRGEVLKFWFGLDRSQWFKVEEGLDHRIRERFLRLWHEKQPLPAEKFLLDPLTALAAVLLFDQLPRNMFRGHADQFATDSLALQVARGAVERGYDELLEKDERVFLYLPFEHSESIDDQRQSLLLFTALGQPDYLDHAKKHCDIIARFGRFPHRNFMLGRAPRPDEIAAGDVNPF
ncbi:MAG: DUF924 family protein [Sphingomicrobium sp.]